jgi:hypothetical protein
MTIVKILVLAALILVGYQQWQRRASPRGEASAPPTATVAATARDTGFADVPSVPGAHRRAVLIFAPENCTEEAARRADALAARLAQAGVIVSRSSSVSMTFPGGETPQIRQLRSVLGGPVPAVFVGTRGKANPSYEEVLAELQAASR